MRRIHTVGSALGVLVALLISSHSARAQALSSVSITPSSLVGGKSATGVVWLTQPAPTGGATINLTSGDPSAASAPAAIVVNAKARSQKFTIATHGVAITVGVTITAYYQSGSKSAVLNVAAPYPVSLTLNPGATVGGPKVAGKVTLDGAAPPGGATVTLSSSNTAAASAPGSVLVPANKTSAAFTVTTHSVAASASSQITGAYGASSASGSLIVNPPTVRTLSLKPATVIGPVPATGMLTLTGPAPAGGLTVDLASDNTSAANPQSTLLVPANSSKATFNIPTLAVTSAASASISATVGGVGPAATLTVDPTDVQSLSFVPAAVVGTVPSTATVMLNVAAPSGGLMLTLKSSSSLAAVPKTLVVAANSSSAIFQVATKGVGKNTSVKISVSDGGAPVTAALTLTPPNTHQFGAGYVTSPQLIAIDPTSQDIYVACATGSVVKFDQYGDYLATLGTSGQGKLVTPIGVAVDRGGNVYACDYGANVCQEFTSNGAYIQTFSGASDGVYLGQPTGVAVDGSGNVYVADDDNSRIVVFTPYGSVNFQFTTIIGADNGGIAGTVGITLDGGGNLWVADYYYHVIAEYTAGGALLAQYGSYYTGIKPGFFSQPYSVFADPNGNIWVSDDATQAVQEFNNSGQFLNLYRPPTKKTISTGVAMDRTGHVFVSDSGNNYIEVFVP